MARQPRKRHATSLVGTQVDHHVARRRHRIPGHGHHSTGRCRLGKTAETSGIVSIVYLGDDAILFRTPLHARPGEAGAAVLRHRAADRQSAAGREVRLPPGTERQQATVDLGEHAEVDPRRYSAGHRSQWLSRIRWCHRVALQREWQSGHQCDCFHRLTCHFSFSSKRRKTTERTNAHYNRSRHWLLMSISRVKCQHCLAVWSSDCNDLPLKRSTFGRK